MDEVIAAGKALSGNLEIFHFRDALKDAMNIARAGNRYLADTEPWKKAKTDMERVETILNVALQICANISVAFEPFMPFMAASLKAQLHLPELTWEAVGRFDLLHAGHVVAKPELLFTKIEDETVAAQIKKLEDARKANELNSWTPDKVADTVDFETFEKVDMRVGTVLECDKVPKADKLLRFRIDDGMGGRTIVSGVAKYYKPEELVGKQVCFVANFAPRKLKGVESQGMILSAVQPDGSLVVLSPQGPITPGAKIG